MRGTGRFVIVALFYLYIRCEYRDPLDTDTVDPVAAAPPRQGGPRPKLLNWLAKPRRKGP